MTPKTIKQIRKMTFKNNNYGIEVLTFGNPIKFQKFDRNLLGIGTDTDTYTFFHIIHLKHKLP